MVRALDGVDMEIRRGEAMGLVGETGCGKSVLALSILGLVPPPGRIVGGEVWFKGRNLVGLAEEELRKIRGKEIGMVFQDPTTYMNPVMTVGEQISEAIALHRGGKASGRGLALEKAIEILKLVRMPYPEKVVDQFPHELSGGMKQRAMVAVALSCNPDLLIADEATTALDVTAQAQILGLLSEIKRDAGMAMLTITHDLGVVAELCDKVAVMYSGVVVELAKVTELFNDPLHPYTRGLLGALPKLDDPKGRLRPIPGSLPDPTNPPGGCRFHPRCPSKMEACKKERPPMVEVSRDRYVSCHLYGGGVLNHAEPYT